MMAWLWIFLAAIVSSGVDPYPAHSEPVLPTATVAELGSRLKQLKCGEASFNLDTLSAERYSVEACFRSSTHSPFCIQLRHPSRKLDGDRPAGAFVIGLSSSLKSTPSTAILDCIARTLVSLAPDSVWAIAKQATPKLPDNLSSDTIGDLIEVMEDLLNQDQTDATVKLLKISQDLRLPENRLLPLRICVAAQTGDFTTAKRILDQTSDSPDSVPLTAAALWVAVLSNDSPNWKKLFESNILPNNLTEQGRTLVHIGEWLTRNKEDVNIMDFWESTLNQLPTCEPLWSAYTEHMLETEQFTRLVATADQALLLHPEATFILNAKASALRRLHRYPEAMRIYEKLYELTGNIHNVVLHSTVAARSLDDAPYEAIRARHAADPDNLLFQHTLAVTSYYRRNYETVIPLMDNLREKMPDSARVYIYGAMSRYELGDWEGCREWLSVLESHETTDPDLYYCLAILWHRRDRDKALAYLDRYFAYPPEPEDDPTKRERAYEYRQRLVAGQSIPAWIPAVERRAGFPWGWSALAGCLLLVLAVAVRTRKHKRPEVVKPE